MGEAQRRIRGENDAVVSSPLTERFPATASIPRVLLGEWPTPVACHSELGVAAGVPSLWIKHDDVSAEPYGGNKVRKLEFLLATAMAGGCKSVLTFGAYGSNHVVATSIYSALLGLDLHAVLTPQPVTSYLRKNLLADAATGVTLHCADSVGSALRMAVDIRARLAEADGCEPLVIPFGGTNALGTIGFVNAGLELSEQISAGLLPEPDFIYVPMGSAGTAVGLAIGLAAEGYHTRVQGVRVLPETTTDEIAIMRTVAEAVATLREADLEFPMLALNDLAIDVRDEFLGEGYAESTPSGRRAVQIASEHGVALETTYTGKAFSALMTDAAEGRLDGRKVLFWDTYNSRPMPAGEPGLLPPLLRELAGI
jgi:D-cysteine desulfhydrase